MTIAAQWYEGFECQAFVSEINECKKLSTDGKVSFSGLRFQDALLGVQRALDFDLKVHHCYFAGVVWRAVVETAKAGSVTKSTLLKAIKDEVRTHLRLPQQRFVVQSQMSIHRGSHSLHWRYRLSQAAVTVGSRRRFDTTAIDREIARKTDVDKTRWYLPCHAAVRARSAIEAGYLAIDAFDVVRAVWNWGLNRHVGWRWSSDPARVNGILAGPFHTLHFANGQLASEQFFFETWSTGPPRRKAVW